MQFKLNNTTTATNTYYFRQNHIILIENFKFGGLVKFGLDYDSLKVKFPKLIYCSITGFGQTGPYRHLPGYDLLVQGMSGMMSVTGAKDGEPQKIGVALADIMTGLYGTIAIEAALVERQKSGLGQHIDMALLDSMVGVLANIGQNYFASGKPPKRIGNQHPSIVPYQLFHAKDSPFLLAVGNDSQFSHLCQAIGLPDIAQNPLYLGNEERVINRETLQEILQSRFLTFERDQLLDMLGKVNVPAGPVNNIEEALNDPQVMAREMVQRVPAPDFKNGEIKYIKNPIRFSRSALAPIKPAPILY